MQRTMIGETELPGTVGCYVVYKTPNAERALYVGMAGERGLHTRWSRDHLGRRSGSSALRRSLGVHLGLVDEKLRRPNRYYPPEVEATITEALRSGYIELYPCASVEEARRLEMELISQLDPILNVQRN